MYTDIYLWDSSKDMAQCEVKNIILDYILKLYIVFLCLHFGFLLEGIGPPCSFMMQPCAETEEN